MIKRKFISTICLILITLIVFVGHGIASDDAIFGGTLRIALTGEPDTLDMQTSSGTPTAYVAHHMFERLFTFTEGYEVVPDLVKDYEVKEEGTLIVLHLREGVLFHNGKEMIAEDVVASLNRWGITASGGRGPTLFARVEKVDAEDKYTVNIHLTERFGPWMNMLAIPTGGCIILPKEIMEAAGATPIAPEDYIGTGPYRFVEWRSDQYILFERFDEYVARDEESDGWSGERVAYFDELRFIPVSDVSTRIAGLRAGDFDFAFNISGDFYRDLDSDPNVVTIVQEEPNMVYAICNSSLGILSEEGPMKDPWKLRQAMQAALDCESIMEIAVGEKSLYDLESSWMAKSTPFYSTIGSENYNQANVEKAQRLAEEAGYNGEQIRFMTYTDNAINYRASEVAAAQLRSAGFNIDLQIYDWATMLARRVDPELWDLFVTGHGYYAEPTLYTIMSPSYAGWWDTDRKRELLRQLNYELGLEARVPVWNEIQALMWEEVPVLKFGDLLAYNIASTELQNLSSVRFPFFWNVWFK